MHENLRKLYNTLINIETKGDNTKMMCACLQYVEQLIAETAPNTAPEAVPEQSN